MGSTRSSRTNVDAPEEAGSSVTKRTVQTVSKRKKIFRLKREEFCMFSLTTFFLYLITPIRDNNDVQKGFFDITI